LFFWLSGWPEADSALIIEIETGDDSLFTPEYDETYLIWTGPSPLTPARLATVGFKNVLLMGSFPAIVAELSGDVFSAPGAFPAGLECETGFLLRFAGKARRVKSQAEIECLRAASRITGEAFSETMRKCISLPITNALVLNSLFQLECARRGCVLATPTVAGSGASNYYLHRERNELPISPGELILLDGGAEVHHYAGDISRTFPVTGKFSVVQARVYNAIHIQIIIIS
jgi:Xaa-Pro aminopeptidase